jgi:hypothetical protein
MGIVAGLEHGKVFFLALFCGDSHLSILGAPLKNRDGSANIAALVSVHLLE